MPKAHSRTNKSTESEFSTGTAISPRTSEIWAKYGFGEYPPGSPFPCFFPKSVGQFLCIFALFCPFWALKRLHSPVLEFSTHTIGDSRITFHHFIFRELFLVIISSWFTPKNSGRIISRNLSDLYLLPHLFFASDICNHYIRILWGNYFS